MMPMESQNNGLKPGGNGNWEETKKKSSNSDEICESDIENGEKFFFFKMEKSPYCRFGTPNLWKMA